MQHIILDFDGVIADTFDFHRGEVKRLYDIALEAQEYRDMHDGNFYDQKDTKLSGVSFSGYAEAVSEGQARTRPFPGALEAIRNLSKNRTLHLVTSGWEIQVEPFLVRHNIYDSFKELLYADYSLSKQVKLQKVVSEHEGDSIFVTDTLGDIREAKEVGVPVIAVTFGFHQRDHLQLGSPEFLADSWAEITQIIETSHN